MVVSGAADVGFRGEQVDLSVDGSEKDTGEIESREGRAQDAGLEMPTLSSSSWP